jgi:hypothetical protein
MAALGMTTKPMTAGFNGIFEIGVGALQSEIGMKKGTRTELGVVYSTFLKRHPCLWTAWGRIGEAHSRLAKARSPSAPERGQPPR